MPHPLRQVAGNFADQHLTTSLGLALRILDRYKREGRPLSMEERVLLEQVGGHAHGPLNPIGSSSALLTDDADHHHAAGLSRCASKATAVASPQELPDGLSPRSEQLIPTLSPRTQHLIRKLQSAVGVHSVYRDSLVRKSELDSINLFVQELGDAPSTRVGLAKPLARHLLATVLPMDTKEGAVAQTKATVYLFSDSDMFLFDPVDGVRLAADDDAAVSPSAAAVVACARSLHREERETEAFYPLKTANACFGAVWLQGLPEPPSQTTRELVETALSIAALHLTRQRLFDSLQWQVEKAEAMLTMAMQLASETLDSRVLTESIMSTARNLCESERCKIFLVSGEGSVVDHSASNIASKITAAHNGATLLQEGSDGPPLMERTITLSVLDNGRTVTMSTLEAGIAGHVAKTGKTVNIRDAQEDDLTKSWHGGLNEVARNIEGDGGSATRTEGGQDEDDVRTMLCMPVFYENTIVAVAQLINKCDAVPGKSELSVETAAERRRCFNRNDVELFSTFALFVGICLRNCRINERLIEEKRKSEAVLDVVSLLSKTDIRDVNAILGHVMLGARKLLNADRASVFLLDKERNELYSKVATGGREIRFPSGKGIAGTVAISGVAENIQDAYTDPRFNRDIDKQFGYRTLSILCEPIALNGEVLAVAQLVNKTQPDGAVTPFSFDDQLTFRTFALFAGISIANSHLLEFAVKAGNEAMALTAVIDSCLPSNSSTPRKRRLFSSPAASSPPVSSLELERIDGVTFSALLFDATSIDFSIFDFIEAQLPVATSGATGGDAHASQAVTTGLALDAVTALIVRLIVSTGLPELFKCPVATLSRFVIQCRRRYRKVPYHNFVHVADVCQTLHTFLFHGNLRAFLTDLECFVLLITALVHDLDHMGLNNSFHLKTDSPLGILSSSSGNNSVLEVHHCNLAIEILAEDEANVFCGLPPADVTYAYRCMIDCVLATDMARHEELMRNFAASWTPPEPPKPAADATMPSAPASIVSSLTVDVSTEDAPKPAALHDEYHRRLLMQMLLKAGDISNVTKPFEVSRRWAVAVTEEFYQQGDKEKERGVAVLPMFDRTLNMELARGQLGFINFVARKFFDVLSDSLPALRWTAARVASNRAQWESL